MALFSKGWALKSTTVLGKVFIWSMGLFGFDANASNVNLFVEPYLGIGKMEIEFDSTSFGTFKDVSNGFFVGSKIGATFSKKFFVGGDYHVGGPFKFDSNLNDAEWNHTMLGVGAGGDYKIIRFWLGYYFDSDIDDSTNNVKYFGTAIKGGFGLIVNKKLRANLDLIFYDIEKEEVNGVSRDVDGISLHSTHVSVSFPFNF